MVRVNGTAAPAGIVITELSGIETGDGPLRGLRLAVKDNIDVAGAPTTGGSRIFGHEPALATAPTVAALATAGARPVAKVNLHEFAYGVSSDNPWHGRVPNPRFPDRIPGGSSGGSAAAIAAGIAELALGTDTAGSIRIPAACTGVVGLRPRNGSLDLAGVQPLCPSFDTVGPMAASVSLVAEAWRALSEGASSPGGPLARAGAAGGRQGDLAGGGGRAPLRVGVCGDPDPAALGILEGLGVQTVRVELPLDEIEAAFWPAFRAEIARAHQATYPRLAGEYDPNVAAKLAGTQGIPLERYRASRERLAALRERLLGEWRRLGAVAVVSPVLGIPLPRVGEREEDYRDLLGLYAVPASALDLAALAVGDLQIMARSEREALDLGIALERAGLTPVAPRLG